MSMFFFDWHSAGRRHLTHTRFRMLAALTLICGLLMFFLIMLSEISLPLLSGATILALLLGMLALILSFRLAKLVLGISILLIEYAVVAATGSLSLAVLFLIPDAALAWLLLRKDL